MFNIFDLTSFISQLTKFIDLVERATFFEKAAKQDSQFMNLMLLLRFDFHILLIKIAFAFCLLV